MIHTRPVCTFSVTLALALLTSLSAAAQTPAAPPAAPPPPPPREGSVNFSFVGTSGNSSTEALGLSGEFIARPAPWVFTTKAGYVRNSSDGELKAEAFKASFRAAREITDRLAAYGQYSFLRDEFSGIEQRHGIDGGIEYLVIKPDPHMLKVDAGIGYANEQRVLGDDLSTAIATFGATYKLKLSPTAEFSEEPRFEFSLSDGSDWRFNNLVGVTAQMTKLFALKASNAVRYVNAPVPGFEKTDTITSLSLVLKF